ncbi:UbiD family decarboxylase [Pelotomaculum sp. PtaB.Bin117]|uniref:UbiD family decarboxylase n=1 Tax=Pelotomaculum sp. PtaB.Bin117 TaxID=1811694 RepID=UPI0009D5FAF9|nr:UbiD family decarboxylase [Pelotomaculum sp. PtaB.Bin117]OPX87994.1 MAG: Phenolic acid decarboxylase subunit C [Pelotomaculum sp. PtaB.Bin117]
MKDLRHFIGQLEQNEELVRIKKEVDWDIELGAISRRVYDQYGPCLWFEKIKDYPEGYTVINGECGTWRRVAIAMGLDADTPLREIYKEYEKRIEGRVQPNIVDRKSAPCKENVFIGEQADIYRLPAPLIHEGDGGRYIGTWDAVITKDPETNWTNWGMYRFMIHNQNFLAGWPQTTSQFAMMLNEKYVPKNQPMPVALVIGSHPLDHMVATAPMRPGVNEAEVAGSLRGEPVDLVKCETSDIMVPANAEIIIEGEIPTDAIVPDGPFGEYPGFRSGTMAEGVAFRIKAITHRNNPILSMTALGAPVDDSSIAASLTAAVGMKLGLQRRGVDVTDVYVPPEGVTHLVIVGVKTGGIEVTRKVLDFFIARRVMVSKVIVVDKDVDVFDMKQWIHAFATKCHPGRSIVVEHFVGKSNALTPCYDADERRILKGAFAAFDATWPLEWPKENIPPRATFKEIYSQETQDKVLAKWHEYGF